ncbi:MAG: hypothetical protein ACXWMC_07315, partial [Syntrophales bacterium]
RREFSSRKGKSKDLRVSNRNTLSLKENLKEGKENIENRMTKGLRKLPPIISVGQSKKTRIADIQDYFGMKSSSR